MSDSEILDKLLLIKLLLKDIPKKYQFLKDDNLSEVIEIIIKDYKNKGIKNDLNKRTIK